MWQDMVLYWAWRGHGPQISDPPTKKRIEYAEIVGPGKYLNGAEKGELRRCRLAVTVFDDDVPTEVNREELEWHRKHGAEIIIPSSHISK